MNPPSVSFEFFPPRSDAQSRRFWRSIGSLENFSPEWISITFGAQRTDSAASFDAIETLSRDTRLPIAAHLTCGGRRREDMQQAIERFRAAGVRHVVALRGDQGSDGGIGRGERLSHALDLVSLLVEAGGFEISVAAYPEVHPEAADEASDLDWLARKFEAGASRALTQFFFDADRFLRWRDRARARGIAGPLVPGILPVHDIERVRVFAESCGASVPKALIARFDGVAEPLARDAIAIDLTVELCSRLQREGVDAFHLYTLNQSRLVGPIVEALGVGRRGLHQTRSAA